MLTCMLKPALTASLSTYISHLTLLWAHNCRADDTATVIVLQLAALPHWSAWLSY